MSGLVEIMQLKQHVCMDTFIHIYHISETPPRTVILPLPWEACCSISPLSLRSFPKIQPEYSLVQLDTIQSHSIVSYMGEETVPHLAAASLQVCCP